MRDSDTGAVYTGSDGPASAGLGRTADPGGRLRVTDRARFSPDAPGADLAGTLVSRAPMTAEDGRLVVTGERSTATVAFEADIDVAIERVEDHSTGGDVWRARLSTATDGRTASIEATVTPQGSRPN